MLTTACLLVLVAKSPAWNKNLTLAAGGLSLESMQVSSACWFDPKTKFFALKQLDCDGAHRSIMITRDRRNVGAAGYDTTRFGRVQKDPYDRKPQDHPFPIATKHGITIGMSKDSVLKKLGKPTKTAVRGKSKEFWCAMYKQVVMDTKEDGAVLRNTYIFKNGKLIELSLNLDGIPGCGEESLSDQGWPWTKF